MNINEFIYTKKNQKKFQMEFSKIAELSRDENTPEFINSGRRLFDGNPLSSHNLLDVNSHRVNYIADNDTNIEVGSEKSIP